MALVVITLQDEDAGTVDCKFLFEPEMKDGKETPAQQMTGRMFSVVQHAIGTDESGDVD
jgi:hypothetical protein